MSWNLGSIADAAYVLIDSVPSTISGTPMETFANLARLYVNNVARVSLGSTGIDDKYASVLVNLTAAKTLSRMAGVGIDFGFTLGDLHVTEKGKYNSQELAQIGNFLDQANAELDFLKPRFGMVKSNG